MAPTFSCALEHPSLGITVLQLLCLMYAGTRKTSEHQAAEDLGASRMRHALLTPGIGTQGWHQGLSMTNLSRASEYSAEFMRSGQHVTAGAVPGTGAQMARPGHARRLMRCLLTARLGREWINDTSLPLLLLGTGLPLVMVLACPSCLLGAGLMSKNRTGSLP